MIRVEELQKTYYTGTVAVEALQGVSFEISKGEFVAVMGASGSGKSTLMNLLGLLDSPSGGKYILDGIDISGLAENEFAHIRNQKVGFVFQAFNLLPRLTALKNVELPMLYAGIKAPERRTRAVEALERMGLADRLDHRPYQLSGGQNQRVAIARAMANKPAILLADEPTGALDSGTSLEIMQIFQELNHNEHATIIVVTHEEEIARHSQRILRLSDGQLIADEQLDFTLNAADALHKLESEVENS